MPRYKRIAAPPGETVQDVQFTTAEETARDSEEAQAALKDRQTRLAEEFIVAYSEAVVNNNANQRAEIIGIRVDVLACLSLNDWPAARDLIDTYTEPPNLSPYKTNMLAIIDGPELA